MLTMLGVFFSEVSGFGFTLKARVDRAERNASEARREARDALLASRYNHIRSEYRSGSERDNLMRDLWKEMVEEFKEQGNFDMPTHLHNRNNAGMRLAGYAYLYANPDARKVADLAEATLADNRPFNQEMGLKTLRLLLRDRCDLLDSSLRSRLEQKAADMQQRAARRNRTSKRAAEIEAIFEQCPKLAKD